MSVANADGRSRPAALRTIEILSSCSKSIEAGDPHQSDNSVSELVEFLDTISAAAASEPDNEDAKHNAFETVIDMLAFELPTAVSKFAVVSDRCLETANCVIDRFIAMCSPRDMLPILCEALSKTTKASACIVPLLSGLSKVILSIQRHHFEQVKEAVPIIVKVLKVVSWESNDEETEVESLFDRAVSIANSIHGVSTKLEGRSKEKLCALLGLYVLQSMALVSISLNHKSLSCHRLVLQFSRFFPYCSVSYLGLITGSDVEKMTTIVVGEDENDYMSCLTYVKHGASLSVIWGHISDEVAQAAEEDLTAVKDELRSNQMRRWQTVGMLKHIYSFVNLPWDLKKHAINLLLCITDGNISQKCDDEHTDLSSHIPSLFAALQAIKMVIVHAPDTVLRKLAFDAFKRVLADIPTSQRFDILTALITNTDSSSMIAILLDLVRGEMHMENRKRLSMRNDEVQQTENEECPKMLFWNATVLELVELVLRPPKGGPPSLTEYSDAVQSALNLYRFVLITESTVTNGTGKTNYTEVLSKNNLQKAYNEWLLPLRTLVTGIMAENRKDSVQLGDDTVCTLNPLELVLYRCIELVEEKLKQST
ncbi:hypothetical protein FH972_013099 [Carpinus fangiana]|uniref:Aberrant root formation protein 4 n=1 Tax=Carpinus fangiana TaxID=176857 RepID=A0A5N6R5Z7_9ROSI|nr:hypothetical protein FH972_013099 [Carpinus fangiana]